LPQPNPKDLTALNGSAVDPKNIIENSKIYPNYEQEENEENEINHIIHDDQYLNNNNSNNNNNNGNEENFDNNKDNENGKIIKNIHNSSGNDLKHYDHQSQKSFIYNHSQDRVRQEYLKRVSDQKAYWPTFTYNYEDPSSKEFTTSIQKKSLFSPYLQYLILLNKELSKINDKEKCDKNNKDNMVGGYIVINKDIKGSWTNTEIMKYIKKQRVVNNELNLLLPLKCVVYDCSPSNKYIQKEKMMYYIRLYQKINITNHAAYIDIIIENINSEDMYDYTLLFTVPAEAFDMYICKNENEEVNYHKAEVHIEHPNNEYDHFKISCIIGPNNIVEFIQKLRECRGLDYDNSLPNPSQIKSYDKTRESERKIKLLNAKNEMIKLRIKNRKEE